MFDIAWSELLIIGIVALVVIGPKELPGVLRGIGQMMSKVRRMASEFQGQFNEAMREAELEDLRKQAEKLNLTSNPLESIKDEITKPIDEINRDVQASLEAPPASVSVPAEKTGETDPVSAPKAPGGGA